MGNVQLLEAHGIDLGIFDAVEQGTSAFRTRDGVVHAESGCYDDEYPDETHLTIRDNIDDLCLYCMDQFFTLADHSTVSIVDEIRELLMGEEDLASFEEDDRTTHAAQLRHLGLAEARLSHLNDSTPETAAWGASLLGRLGEAVQHCKEVLDAPAWKDVVVTFHKQQETEAWKGFLEGHGYPGAGTVDEKVGEVFALAARVGIPEALTTVLLEAETHWLPQRPHRPLGEGEDLGAYVAEVRSRALREDAASHHEDVRESITSEDRQEVVAAVHVFVNDVVQQSVIPYTKRTVAEAHLVVAPKVVVESLQKVSRYWADASVVSEAVPVPDPVTLETMVALWDPKHPVFSRLENLQEAGLITQ